ncbi:MAG: response regulator [Spirochaetota bacterium]
MDKKIKILFLEDNDADAELIMLEFIKSGFKFEPRRVETREQYIRELSDFGPDIILADYSLPAFDGMEALRMLYRQQLRIPFIFVTGSLGEELAVETVKRGATDYILKDNLSRLVPTVKRALRETKDRRKLEEAEKALRENERMLNEAEKVARIGSWTFNFAEKKVKWSSEMYSLFGINPDEFDGSMKMAIRNVHCDDLPFVKKIIKNVLMDNRLAPMEFRISCPDYERIACIEGKVEKNEKGEPLRVAGYVQDITDRRKIETELLNHRQHLEDLVKKRTTELEKINTMLESEIAERKQIEKELIRERNMLRTLINSLPDDIYAKDKESRFIMANLHVLRTFKQNNFEDIYGKTDFDILPKYEAEKAYSKDLAVLQHNGQTISYEEHIMEPGGKIRWLDVTKAPMRDKKGEITGLVGINRDITQFKEIEENLQKAKEAAETANLAKSTFLSNMSHEIRTPLNAILGFSELILHDENLTKDQVEWIQTINRSGEHLLALINDILEVSRIEAGRITFNPSTFDLHAMLLDIESMFRVETDEKKLNFFLEYQEDLPRFVVTDEGKLRQILINIVGNSVKFTENGGVVLRIRTETEKSGRMRLKAEVEDTGPGIAEKDMAALFQMFAQAEAGIKEGGTGLGLAISQQYAKIMGGIITVKSELGKYTCFEIKINIERGADLPANENVKNHKRRVIGIKPGQKQYKVLVADDRENNRKLLRDMLTSVGFAVEIAVNGMEAIEKFEASKPDIILMDMRMPVLNGYEAIRKIRAMDSGKTPIAAVTASAFLEDRKKALDAGADTYLRKPFKENEIFICIGSCLGIQYVFDEK